MPRFVLNDGSKNSYGFRVDTDGIDLKRFTANPVMLDSHYRSNQSVIGRWEDIKIEDGRLTALPVFDEEDDAAKKIQGKVDRGFIKGASMGLKFDPDNMIYKDGELILEHSELYEASIVAVPSNQNALQLIDAKTGIYLEASDIKEICLSAMKTEPQTHKPKSNLMKNIMLSAAIWAILGFEAGKQVEPAELESRIKKLNAEKEAAELQLSAKIKAEEKALLNAIETKVETAVKSGKFSADQKENLINLGVANPDLLEATLKAVGQKQSLGDQIKHAGAPQVIKTADEFQKLSLEEQLKFKSEQPDVYRNLFNN